MPEVSRRDLLRSGALIGAAAALIPTADALAVPASSARLVRRASWPSHVRRPGSLPDPQRRAGTPDHSMPFDHIVVCMMENHSFDNYLGMLPVRGQPRADGFRLRAGRPVNSNPLHARHGGPEVGVFRLSDPCQPQDAGTQSWNDTHTQIDGGRMDGFAETGVGSMAYYDSDVLPFYYGLARTFPLANRWFCSAPCQTYPNRRFLMAGTAYGDIATSSSSLEDPPPPNGTIFDRLSAYGLSWKNYFSDLPQTAIIPSVLEKYAGGGHIVPIAEFFADCAAGRLSAVSFVDPEFGALDDVGGPIRDSSNPILSWYGQFISAQGGDEENPQDVQIGQAFVARVVHAVLSARQWSRTLFLWTYDEHGGYYDHVPPPAALAPDAIPPRLHPGDAPGGYTIYGPRVPAVVLSPYARPHAVTDVVHDHTSVLATIEAKWNLPAMTYRDANAATMMDFLDLRSRPHFLDPPELPAAPDPAATENACFQGYRPGG